MAGTDWYAVLGVGRTASQAQIARAFRRLAFRWHPDRNADHPELAHRQFLLVHRAYEVLKDPSLRREFDFTQGDRSPAARPPAPPARARGAPAARPRPGAPAPAERPRSARTWLSRAAWLPLSLVIRLVSFVVLLLVGPIAERLARHELDRKVPKLVDFLFPIGRLSFVCGIVLIVLQRTWRPLASPAFAIGLVVLGVLIFVIERIALASVWAFGRGRGPRG
jgi:hypothetical protein